MRFLYILKNYCFKPVQFLFSLLMSCLWPFGGVHKCFKKIYKAGSIIIRNIVDHVLIQKWCLCHLILFDYWKRWFILEPLYYSSSYLELFVALNNSQCAAYYVIAYIVSLVKNTKISFFSQGHQKSVFLCKGEICVCCLFSGLKDKIKRWLKR